jgi:phage baseplate assembly protein W
MPLLPHFAVPFEVSAGAPLEVEQDTAAEISQCVRAILHTPEGSMLDDPEFGIPDETFAELGTAPDASLYLSTVERFEPRAELLGEATVEGEVEQIVIRQETE